MPKNHEKNAAPTAECRQCNDMIYSSRRASYCCAWYGSATPFSVTIFVPPYRHGADQPRQLAAIRVAPLVRLYISSNVSANEVNRIPYHHAAGGRVVQKQHIHASEKSFPPNNQFLPNKPENYAAPPAACGACNGVICSSRRASYRRRRYGKAMQFCMTKFQPSYRHVAHQPRQLATI
jgi:(2Fe-2S) ferredoxin